MKTYLFSFNLNQIDPDIIKHRLNDTPEIIDWLLLTGGLIMVKSPEKLSDLAQKVHISFPGMLFLITEASPESCEGWMPKAVWEFINQQPQRQAIPA
jgi:hypothetical protein